MTKLTKKAQASLNAMACAVLDLDTLETRNSDSLDFHEHAVWEIEEVIRRAYQMGLEAGSR